MLDKLYKRPLPPRRPEDFTSEEVDSYRKKRPFLTQGLTTSEVKKTLAQKERLENHPEVQAFNARARNQQRKN